MYENQRILKETAETIGKAYEKKQFESLEINENQRNPMKTIGNKKNMDSPSKRASKPAAPKA